MQDKIKELLGTEVEINHRNGEQNGKLKRTSINSDLYYVRNRKGFVHFRIEEIDTIAHNTIFLKYS